MWLDLMLNSFNILQSFIDMEPYAMQIIAMASIDAQIQCENI